MKGFFWFVVGNDGSGDGELDMPAAIAIDSAGHILVADTGNNRTVVFNQDGSYRGASLAAAPPTYRWPDAVAFTNSCIYVVDDQILSGLMTRTGHVNDPRMALASETFPSGGMPVG